MYYTSIWKVLFDIVKRKVNVRLVRRSRTTPFARAALFATDGAARAFDKHSTGNQNSQCFQWSRWPAAVEIKGAIANGRLPADHPSAPKL